MKRSIKKVGIAIMASLMVTLSACAAVNKETAKEVEKALSQKYGETFVATHIGDRLNKDTAKLYVHPAQNEDAVFTAIIDKEGSVTDDYIETLVEAQARDVIVKAAAEQGMTCFARISLTGQDDAQETNAAITVSEYVEKYAVTDFFMYLLVKQDGFSEEAFISAMKKAEEEVSCKLIISGYLFEEDPYANCAQLLTESPDAGATMIRKKAPIGEFGLVIENGQSSLSAEELAEAIRGEE